MIERYLDLYPSLVKRYSLEERGWSNSDVVVHTHDLGFYTDDEAKELIEEEGFGIEVQYYDNNLDKKVELVDLDRNEYEWRKLKGRLLEFILSDWDFEGDLIQVSFGCVYDKKKGILYHGRNITNIISNKRRKNEAL